MSFEDSIKRLKIKRQPNILLYTVGCHAGTRGCLVKKMIYKQQIYTIKVKMILL